MGLLVSFGFVNILACKLFFIYFLFVICSCIEEGGGEIEREDEGIRFGG